ncbi:MAG TPA: FAD-dependent monooxygenase [Dehalococcoidia bacterium]|nr:FAD-dependent monooxygenase [Dehalococcoidia bacterium]
MSHSGGFALIVGGGIGGLAAARALQGIGWDVLVCEQSPDLRELGAGLSLWTNAVKALRAIGLGEEIAAIGAPIESAELRTWRGRLTGVLPVGAIGRRLGAPSLGVHRADLLALLAGSLPADTVRLDAQCVGFLEDATGVTAHFADGSTQRADLLIGADGLHSTVRTRLFGPGRPRYAGYTCWRGLAAIPAGLVAPDVAFEMVGPGRRFGLMPLVTGPLPSGPRPGPSGPPTAVTRAELPVDSPSPRRRAGTSGARGAGVRSWGAACPVRRVYWFATLRAPAGGRDVPGGRRDAVLDLFQGWASPVREILMATAETDILRHDIFDRPPLWRWSGDRVTLLGDAAHSTTPTQGQGACLAIEDAVVLARCLAAGGNLPAALRAYEAARLQRTALIINQSRVFGWIGHWESPRAARLRDILLRLATPTFITWQLERTLAYDTGLPLLDRPASG